MYAGGGIPLGGGVPAAGRDHIYIYYVYIYILCMYIYTYICTYYVYIYILYIYNIHLSHLTTNLIFSTALSHGENTPPDAPRARCGVPWAVAAVPGVGWKPPAVADVVPGARGRRGEIYGIFLTENCRIFLKCLESYEIFGELRGIFMEG